MKPLTLIAFSGLPGSGKSTLAEALAKRLQWPLFSVDPIESAILRSGFARSFETGLAAYLVAEALAEEQLKLGHSVIIDAVNGVPEARQMWRDLAERHQTRLIAIECVLDRDIHRQRIEARVRSLHGFAEVTWDDVERQRSAFAAWHEPRLVLDSGDAVEANMARAMQVIREVRS